MKVRFVFLLCLSLGIWGMDAVFVFSQEPSATATVGKSDSAENSILRAQLSEMKRSDDRLLTTVLWTLTTSGGIVLILVGFSWFVNFKVYERDKESLKQDLAVAVKNDSATTKESLAKELNASFDKRFKEMESRLQTQFTRVYKGILLTMYWDLEREYKQALEGQKHLAVLLVVTTLLAIALQREDEGQVTTSLDRLRTVLRQEGLEVPAEHVAKLDGTLTRLPDKYGGRS